MPRRQRRRSRCSTGCCCCSSGCSEERRVRDTRGETGPLAQSWARATYDSDVSVALLLSASESAAAPASPISLLYRVYRLQRGEEGQGCSLSHRATQRIEHDSLESRRPGLKLRDRVAHHVVPKLVHFDLSLQHARLLPPLCSARRSSYPRAPLPPPARAVPSVAASRCCSSAEPERPRRLESK